jgi:hypothetical protein
MQPPERPGTSAFASIAIERGARRPSRSRIDPLARAVLFLVSILILIINID